MYWFICTVFIFYDSGHRLYVRTAVGIDCIFDYPDIL